MDDRNKEYQSFVDQCEGMADTETDPERRVLLADRWRKKITSDGLESVRGELEAARQVKRSR